MSDNSPADSASRAKPRRKTLKEGIISFQGGHCTLPATVRDWSESGAKLIYTGQYVLPTRFRLYVPVDAVEVDCTIVWRRKDTVGVKFVSEIAPSAIRRDQVLKSSNARKERTPVGVLIREGW